MSVWEHKFNSRAIRTKFIGNKSTHPEVFCKKSVLRNFAKLAKLTGKYLCYSLFFNSIAGLRPANLLKKRLWHRRFAVSFVKFFKNTFFHRAPMDGSLWGQSEYWSEIYWLLRNKTFQESLLYLLAWKPFKYDKKRFLFHLKSSVCSQDIYIFVWTFWSFRKNGMIRKIRLILKFMTSKAG